MADGTFACGACGKRFPWKAEIAGRKAKCKCGAVLEVPAQDPSGGGDDVDDLYGLAEPAPETKPAKKAVAAAAPAVEPVAAAPSTPASPVYARKSKVGKAFSGSRKKDPNRFTESAMTHMPRDYYLPLAMLAIGTVATLATAMMKENLSMGQVALLAGITELVVAIKTGVLVGLAILIAPKLGVSFGLLKPAILKLAAIVVVSDTVMLWLDIFIPFGIGLGAGSVRMIIVGGVISTMMLYMFDMERDETAMVAVPMAVLSRLLGFFIYLGLAGVLARIEGAPGGGAGGGGATPSGDVEVDDDGDAAARGSGAWSLPCRPWRLT